MLAMWLYLSLIVMSHHIQQKQAGPAFDLVPVTRQKDIMLNVARMHAEQEYNRIMELVDVLQRQADEIKRRLDLTDMVHAAKYDFQIAHGHIYWLAQDTRRQRTYLMRYGTRRLVSWSTCVV
jgi:hypothetical protein